MIRFPRAKSPFTSYAGSEISCPREGATLTQTWVIHPRRLPKSGTFPGEVQRCAGANLRD
jgi:hypothetical protein